MPDPLLDLSRPVLGLIDGEWSAPDSGESLEVFDPSNDEVVGRVAACGTNETSRAIEAAAGALEAWSDRPVQERAKLVRELGHAMLDRREELALLMTREQGKPLREALGEIDYAASFLTDAADRAGEMGGTISPSAREGHRILAIRKPIGVCAIITPWNFPAAMITRKLGPALVCGNTVVVKPAELTPLSAYAIGKLAMEVGLPAGVFNIVTGEPRPIGETLTGDARVRKLSFTGSTAVGRELLMACAPSVKRVSMELGGHAPLIVFEDADLDRALDGVVACKFRNGGQTCIALNRLLVHEAVHDAFVERLVDRVKGLKVGPGTDESSDVGPMISDAAMEKIEKHIADAKSKGGEVHCGGERVRISNAADRFYAPTVITGLTREMLCFREETFGPVIPVCSFRDEDEALDLAHDTEYGLAAYFYTENVSRLVRVAERLQYGIIGANEALPSAAQAPFGGFKQSGLGREGGPWVFGEYTETSYVSLGV